MHGDEQREADGEQRVADHQPRRCRRRASRPAQTANDTSTLTGAGTSTGTGTVAYSYYTNNTCTTAKVAVNTVTVPTSGIVPNSNAAHVGSAGTYYWQAVYSGDANNNTATSSPCTATNNEKLTVTNASPTIATTLSASSVTAGTDGVRHGDAERGRHLDGRGHGGLQLLHQQHLHDGQGGGQHGDGAGERHRAQLERPDLRQRRGPTTGRRSTAATPTTTETSSPCTARNNEQLTVTIASPTITTTLSAARHGRPDGV